MDRRFRPWTYGKHGGPGLKDVTGHVSSGSYRDMAGVAGASCVLEEERTLMSFRVVLSKRLHVMVHIENNICRVH